MASKPATSSSSNAVVGQKVARSTAEPTSPHRRRHGRRERARQRRIASARNAILSYLIYLIFARTFISFFRVPGRRRWFFERDYIRTKKTATCAGRLSFSRAENEALRD
jgi:hypothetical protein